MRLIDDAGRAWRFASVRLAGLGATLFGMAGLFPDVALQAWNALPADTRAAFGPNTTKIVAALLFGLIVVARLFKKEKKDAG